MTATLDIAVKRKRPILPAVWRRPMAVIGVEPLGPDFHASALASSAQ